MGQSNITKPHQSNQIEIQTYSVEKLWGGSHMVEQNNIEDRKHKCFINFDIKNFNPSIQKDHVMKAIQFSKKYTKFTEQ